MNPIPSSSTGNASELSSWLSASFQFVLMFCESDAKSCGCDFFNGTLVSWVIVSLLHLRTLPPEPLSLKQNGVRTFLVTTGRTDCPLRTRLTL